MITPRDTIHLRLSVDDIRAVLDKTLREFQATPYVDNLRHRSESVRFDCRFRGYLGEYCIKRFFWRYGVFVSNEEVNIMEDGSSIDIDLAYQNEQGVWVNFEVKTSLVPDRWDIGQTIHNADVKVIKRTRTIEDLKGDIHIQIYFNFHRSEHDSLVRAATLDLNDPQQIIDALHLNEYRDNILLVGWIDKQTLVQYINALPSYNRTWTFPNAQKDFWRCPFSAITKTPEQLKQFLKRIGAVTRKIKAAVPFLDYQKVFDRLETPPTGVFDSLFFWKGTDRVQVSFSPYIGLISAERLKEKSQELFLVSLNTGVTELWCMNDVMANAKELPHDSIEAILHGRVSERIKESIRDLYFE